MYWLHNIMFNLLFDNYIILLSCIVIIILIFTYKEKIREVFTNKNDNSKNQQLYREDNNSFIQSAIFNGEKIGYVFKNDIDGVGYYKDKY